MPHRVTNFFKASTNSLESQVSNLKKTAANATRRRDSPSRSERSSRSSERAFSYASSVEDDSEDSQAPPYTPPVRKMVERAGSYPADPQQAATHHHHRISFPGIHLGRSKEGGYFGSSPGASLDWKLESPPIVFYGEAENSSGALVSGQLFLNVPKEEGVEFDSFEATLSIHVTQKRPFVAHCHDCTTQVTELNRWVFLERPLLLAKGKSLGA